MLDKIVSYRVYQCNN